MAEGRVQFIAYPHNVFFPGVFLAVTVPIVLLRAVVLWRRGAVEPPPLSTPRPQEVSA